VPFEFANTIGCHRHAVLGDLDLAWHADGGDHGCVSGHPAMMPVVGDLRQRCSGAGLLGCSAVARAGDTFGAA
jgi:hypothetical protein